MLQSNKETKDEYDYYMTFEEMQVLVKCVNMPRVKDKFKLMTWMLILTGRRVGEICAVQVQDFLGHKEFDFSRLNVRLEKTGKVLMITICEPLQAMIKEYIVKHHQEILGGYLFTRMRPGCFNRPFMRTEEYGAFFSKLRRRAVDYCPGYAEVFPNGQHRIRPHTIRAFFETYGLDCTNSLLFVKELMGYSDIATVVVYANKKKVRDELPGYYNKQMNDLGQKLSTLCKGQETLSFF